MKFLAHFFRRVFNSNLGKPYFHGFYKYLLQKFTPFRSLVIQLKLDAGFNMELHLQDWIQQNIFFLGSYESKELAFMSQVLKPESTFIDIGANVGWHSLNAAVLVGQNGAVISFEPFAMNYARIQKNISLNPTLDQIVVEKIGIGAKSDSITLHYNSDDDNAGMASQFVEGNTSEKIQVIAFDQYEKIASLKRIDMIKLDIEGGELNALHGMQKTLKEFKPILMIEFDPEILSKQTGMQKEMISLLSNLNYKPTYFDAAGKLCDQSEKSTSKNIVFWPL